MPRTPASVIDSRYAWMRLLMSVLVCTVGGVGMWSVVVVLPTVQADFGVSRADASFAYTLTMLGFGFGGILMGRIADRYGIFRPLVAGAFMLAGGYTVAAYAQNIWVFAIAHGVMIGLLGSSVSFAPMMADVSLWFQRRRGIAVAIVASGNYLAGTVWPPIVQSLVASYGWRLTHLAIGAFCLVFMLPLAFGLRRRSPLIGAAPKLSAVEANVRTPIPLNPAVLQGLLVVAGVSCCIAMAMPQVHMVAYCGDLGYGVARGAEMLSLMLGCGIISRLVSGVISDKIGGLATLMLGSILQAVALVLYIPFDGLMSLYVISALFGLFQGGIVPSYAIIVRDNFPPQQAGTRVGITLTATLVGMALGGWLSGAIFDWTGSYQAAFINGFLWNLLNIAIVAGLMWRQRSVRHRVIASVA